LMLERLVQRLAGLGIPQPRRWALNDPRFH
jgi:hypothetical protein